MARDYRADPQLSVEEAKAGIGGYVKRAAQAPFKVANAILPLGTMVNTAATAFDSIKPTPLPSGANPAYGIAKAPAPTIAQATQQPATTTPAPGVLQSVNDPRRGTQAPGAAPVNYSNPMSAGSGSINGQAIQSRGIAQAPVMPIQGSIGANAPSGLATPNPVFSRADIADMTPTKGATNAGGAAMALKLMGVRGKMNEANNQQALGIYNAQSQAQDRAAGQGIARQKTAIEAYDSFNRGEIGKQTIAQGVQSMEAQKQAMEAQKQVMAANQQLQTLKQAAITEKDPAKIQEISRQIQILTNTRDKYTPLIGKDQMQNPVYMGAFNASQGTMKPSEQSAPTREDAMSAVSRGASKDEVNKRLVAAGLEPI